MGNKNIYNYKTPKSGHEETGFFNSRGRITRKMFFLRLLLIIGLYLLSDICNHYGVFGGPESRSYIFFETLHIYVLPLLLIIFLLLQGAKRMHDVNKSGWYFFIPFYNIYLCLMPGTPENNDYGINPVPLKNIQFFDELNLPPTEDNKKPLPKKEKKNTEKSTIPSPTYVKLIPLLIFIVTAYITAISFYITKFEFGVSVLKQFPIRPLLYTVDTLVSMNGMGPVIFTLSILITFVFIIINKKINLRNVFLYLFFLSLMMNLIGYFPRNYENRFLMELEKESFFYLNYPIYPRTIRIQKLSSKIGRRIYISEMAYDNSYRLKIYNNEGIGSGVKKILSNNSDDDQIITFNWNYENPWFNEIQWESSVRGICKKIGDNTKVSVQKIGDTVWMEEALNVSHFANGSEIPIANSDYEWKKACSEYTAVCCTNSVDTHNDSKLYNHNCILNLNELAPLGWVIPENISSEALETGNNHVGYRDIDGNFHESINKWWLRNTTNCTMINQSQSNPNSIYSENGELRGIGAAVKCYLQTGVDF